MGFDHMGFAVKDLAKASAFYDAALAPLGFTRKFGDEKRIAYGQDKPSFVIGVTKPAVTGVHVAFVAKSEDEVKAFHAAGCAAGGKDNGAPGPRDYAPGYYAAFVIDPDGNNIEAALRAG